MTGLLLIKDIFHLCCDSLKTMDFKPLDESEFDMGKTMKRHGSVVVITDEEYDRMVRGFWIGIKKY